jgi:hypothetical protein
MLEPTTLVSGARVDYGFGLWSETTGGRRAVYHDGAIPGFHAQAAAYPDAELVVVVLTNANPAAAPPALPVAAQVERAVAARAHQEP